MRIGITFPVYHSSDVLFDFTKQAVESFKSQNHELHIFPVINFTTPELYPNKEKFNLDPSVKEFLPIPNPKGNQVGAAWNHGIKLALDSGCDFVIVPNNDVVCHHKCIDNLVAFADMHPEFLLWSASEWIDIRTLNGVKEADITWSFDEHPHFSFFMVNKKTVDTVGMFDENLRMAYFEDGDMHYRILLSGNKAGKTNAAKFYHYGSRTIKVDDQLFEQNKRSFEDNKNYIQLKWGITFEGKVYDPPEQMIELGFKHPFDNQNKTLKDW